MTVWLEIILSLFAIVVDPAPPSEENDLDVLKGALMNRSLTLFDRYRAMFSLRNMAKVK